MLAGFLAITSIKEYRFLAGAVFFEFSMHNVLFQGGVVDSNLLNPWLIYLAYATVQILTMAYLYFKKAHFIITLLIFINLIFNLLAIQDFTSYKFMSIYMTYKYLVGTIMIFELIYLGLLSQYVRYHITKRWNVNNDYIDSVFCVRRWGFDRSLA